MDDFHVWTTTVVRFHGQQVVNLLNHPNSHALINRGNWDFTLGAMMIQMKTLRNLSCLTTTPMHQVGPIRAKASKEHADKSKILSVSRIFHVLSFCPRFTFSTTNDQKMPDYRAGAARWPGFQENSTFIQKGLVLQRNNPRASRVGKHHIITRWSQARNFKIPDRVEKSNE